MFILKDGERENASLIGKLEGVWKKYMKECQNKLSGKKWVNNNNIRRRKREKREEEKKRKKEEEDAEEEEEEGMGREKEGEGEEAIAVS